MAEGCRVQASTLPFGGKVLRYLMRWAQLIIRLGNKITTNYNMARKKTLH